MIPESVLTALLWSLCVCSVTCSALIDVNLEVVSAPGEDSVLRCTAPAKPGVRYRAVRWYKVGESPSGHLSGLLTKDLPNGTVRWYAGAERQAELLDGSHAILLPNVTCGDRGVYTCHLAAPVGEQNQDGKVLLAITDCPQSPTEHLLRDSMVIAACTVMMFALVIYCMSYVCLKNFLKEKKNPKEGALQDVRIEHKDSHNLLKVQHKKAKTGTSLDAPLKPLDRKDLMLIQTLGPKLSKTPTVDYKDCVCV